MCFTVVDHNMFTHGMYYPNRYKEYLCSPTHSSLTGCFPKDIIILKNLILSNNYFYLPVFVLHYLFLIPNFLVDIHMNLLGNMMPLVRGHTRIKDTLEQ